VSRLSALQQALTAAGSLPKRAQPAEVLRRPAEGLRGRGAGCTLPGMPTRALALPGALLLLLLAGCAAGSGGGAAGSGSATPEPAAAAGLIGPVWSVRDATGVGGTTTVRFDDGTAAIEEGGRSSTLMWAAQGDELLATRSSASLNGPVPTGWMTSATRIEPVGDGWRLLDADGATLARLEPTGGTPAAPMPAVTPGADVTDVAATALEGTWIQSGHPGTAISFDGGSWDATASCETGTPGGSGDYRVLRDGRILVTRGIALRLGCPIGQDRPADRATAIVGVTRAASFAIDGGTLTLFDRSGAEIGSLVRR
jgi:hypothetical protein